MGGEVFGYPDERPAAAAAAPAAHFPGVVLPRFASKKKLAPAPVPGTILTPIGSVSREQKKKSRIPEKTDPYSSTERQG